jgi:hypothetical protein
VRRKEKENRIQAAEMRFLTAVTGCTTESKIRNESNWAEPQIYSTKDKLGKTRTKWREHSARMDEDRLPKSVIRYKSRGRRLQGRSRKRCFP